MTSAGGLPYYPEQYAELEEVFKEEDVAEDGFMKLLVVCGYYDLATPFNGIEHTVSHMFLEPPIRKNVGFTYYEAGHMMYIDKKAREKLHKDVAEFIKSAY